MTAVKQVGTEVAVRKALKYSSQETEVTWIMVGTEDRDGQKS